MGGHVGLLNTAEDLGGGSPTEKGCLGGGAPQNKNGRWQRSPPEKGELWGAAPVLQILPFLWTFRLDIRESERPAGLFVFVLPFFRRRAGHRHSRFVLPLGSRGTRAGTSETTETPASPGPRAGSRGSREGRQNGYD